MSGTTLPLIISKINVNYTNILEEELELNLIKPLQFIMNLEYDNFTPRSSHTNININISMFTPFSVNQQIQLYLHMLSSKPMQHKSGDNNFALYADFLEKTYNFNINEQEITNISHILQAPYNNKIHDKIADIITLRAALECVEQSIRPLELTEQNKQKLSQTFNTHITNNEFDLYKLKSYRFILTELTNNSISKSKQTKSIIALKFINNLKALLAKNKIDIATVFSTSYNAQNQITYQKTKKFFIRKYNLTKPTKNLIFKELFKSSNHSIEQLIINLQNAKTDIHEKFLNFCEQTQDHNSQAKKYWKNILRKQNILDEPIKKISKHIKTQDSCCPCFRIFQSAQSAEYLKPKSPNNMSLL